MVSITSPNKSTDGTTSLVIVLYIAYPAAPIAVAPAINGAAATTTLPSPLTNAPSPPAPPASVEAPATTSVAILAPFIPPTNLADQSTIAEPVFNKPPIPLVNDPIPFKAPPLANVNNPNLIIDFCVPSSRLPNHVTKLERCPSKSLIWGNK